MRRKSKVGGKKMTIPERILHLQEQRKLLEIDEILEIEKGLSSNDPYKILEAVQAVSIKKNSGSRNRKAIMVDPADWSGTQAGHRNPQSSLDFNTLARMSRTPISAAIQTRRKNQIAEFTKPQKDRFSMGFTISKKGSYSQKNKKPQLNSEDYAIIEYITEFVLNCGRDQSWSRDNFDTFARKFVSHSLTWDQACFEPVHTLKGNLHEFYMTDSSLMRISDSYDDASYDGPRKKIGGYFPSYVQVLHEKEVAEFYPWELCFAKRNPSASIYNYGYGRSELEDLVQIITSHLWADEYNRNFFKNGAAPKGIIKVKGGADTQKLEEFRQEWRAMISGVNNAFRTPIIDTEEMDFLDLQKSSKDMEFGQWKEYLIKLHCALYVIDPSEINFHLSGSSDSKPMFESNNASRLKYSRDNGLRPLLKHLESHLNIHVVSRIHPDFYLSFVGIDSESETDYRKGLTEQVKSYRTIDEIRAELDLPPMPNGTGAIILDPTYVNYITQQQMSQEGGEGGEGGGEPDAADPFADVDTSELDDGNPFTKAFSEHLLSMNTF